jgi:hypothetical protein
MLCSVRFAVPSPSEASPNELDWSFSTKRLPTRGLRTLTLSASNKRTLAILKDLFEEPNTELPLTVHDSLDRADRCDGPGR